MSIIIESNLSPCGGRVYEQECAWYKYYESSIGFFSDTYYILLLILIIIYIRKKVYTKGRIFIIGFLLFFLPSIFIFFIDKIYVY